MQAARVAELEGELEEANESIKRYYEAVAEKDLALSRRASEMEALEKKVQRLAYEKELLELQRMEAEESSRTRVIECCGPFYCC